MTRAQTTSLRGFTAPLDSDGAASLYGPPPWRFCGRSLTVIAQCDRDAVATLLPPPLEPTGDGLVRFTVHDLTCDLGLGWTFAQRNPERSQVREAVIGVCARHDGKSGYYDPFLWCNSDAEIAVGREVFGWPQRQGDIWLTPPHGIHGIEPGDWMAGKVARLGHPVFSIDVQISGPGQLPAEIPAFETFYTMRVLPDPAGGPTLHEVYASDMADITLADSHLGQGSLHVEAGELVMLQPQRVIAARANSVAWTKGFAHQIG